MNDYLLEWIEFYVRLKAKFHRQEKYIKTEMMGILIAVMRSL